MPTIHAIFPALAIVGVVFLFNPTELGNHLLFNMMLVILVTLFGLYIALTRILPRCHHPVELLFLDGVFAAIGFSFGFLISTQLVGDGSTANRPDLAMIVTTPAIAALIGKISLQMMIGAARLTPAAKLALVSYLEIVSSR